MTMCACADAGDVCLCLCRWMTKCACADGVAKVSKGEEKQVSEEDIRGG